MRSLLGEKRPSDERGRDRVGVPQAARGAGAARRLLRRPAVGRGDVPRPRRVDCACSRLGRPLLLLCMARPELLERRPSWPVPLRLEPLQADEADALIGDSLPEELASADCRKGGWQPALHHRDAGAGDGRRRARGAADADGAPRRPTRPARAGGALVLERGAVEGEVFHRGAVQALAPEEPEVLPKLAALVRHELIRPERSQFLGDDGFRFRHLLIRDAAYDALPKSIRADLHLRFADWLEQTGGLVELDELVGYHLEQAARYGAELDRPDPALTLRAGDRLLAAGRRALDRGDERAGAGLLERALTLTRPIRLDVHAEIDLAAAFWGEPERAARIADEAAVLADEAGDETGAALGPRSPPRTVSLSPRSRRTSSRRSSSRRADGSRRQRITSGCTTSGRHSATALRTHAVELTTGLTHPSRHAATAASPVARLRNRSISVSHSSQGRGPPTRRSRPFSVCSRRRGRRAFSSAVPGCSPCSTAAKRPGRTPARRTRGLAS